MARMITFHSGLLALVWGLLTALPLWLSARPDHPIPYRDGDRWGYCSAVMEPLLPAQYDFAWPFQHDRAMVRYRDQVGLIDRDGNWVIPAAYDMLVLGEQVILRKGDAYGLATRDGRMLTEMNLGYAHPWPRHTYIIRQPEGEGLLDSTGQVLVAARYDRIEFVRDDAGHALDLLMLERDGLRGFADICGNLLLEPSYADVSHFSEGYAVVKKGYRSGLVDLEGREVVPAVYEQVLPVSQGLAAVAVRGKWGFVDTQGKEVIPLQYDAVNGDGFHHGMACVLWRGNWVLLRRDGSIEPPLEGEYVFVGPSSDGLRVASKSMPPKGVISFGYIRSQGKPHLPFRYAEAHPFKNGLAIVAQHKGRYTHGRFTKSYGIIDRNGEWVLEPKPSPFALMERKQDSLITLGWCTTSTEKGHCKVNARGHRFDCVNSSLFGLQLKYEQVRCEQQQLVAVRKAGKWGFVNYAGEVVIPFRYALVDCFQNGYALVWPSDESDFHFYIDAQGREYYRPEVSGTSSRP